jgi:L-ascorbate metabolism protein UlaG (beta-lactamase superfamily)
MIGRERLRALTEALALPALLALTLVLLLPASARAAGCQLVASGPRPMPASLRLANSEPGRVDVTFLGHSSFLIQTPQGASAVSDYNGYVKPTVLPDIVTMNVAHSSHYTDAPEPEIKFVLRGWTETGVPARHDLRFRDLRVRNVTTDIRGFGGLRPNGNSIFIFEVAELCIVHLGHLHHLLTPTHLAEIGQVDVLMMPVDGQFTMGQLDMVEVIAQLKPPLVLPMHYFTADTLAAFLDRARPHFGVRMNDVARITLSRATLPAKTEILVLPGR